MLRNQFLLLDGTAFYPIINELEKRRGKNITAVALANKNVRIAWALLSQQATFKKIEGVEV
jgi:hypothetical protein